MKMTKKNIRLFILDMVDALLNNLDPKKPSLVFYTGEDKKIRCFIKHTGKYICQEITEWHRGFSVKTTTGNKEKIRKKVANIVTTTALKEQKIPSPYTDGIDVYP